MLSVFQKLWERYPDLRFGQLISNLLREDAKEEADKDLVLFYLEDDDWLEYFERALREGR